jgi:RNA polymerase I-specific transcription initiation factor RRN6
MAEKAKAGRSTDRPLPNVALEHRLNHLQYGTLGRLSYIPVKDESQHIGRLQINRELDSKSYFNLLSDFEDVSPATRTVLSGAELGEPAKVVRGQKNWLLKTHPEAIVVGSEVASFLPDEVANIKAAITAEDGDWTASLALGEITDHTGSHQVIARPAMARAAGEGGHILRIVTLEQELEGWPEKGLSIQAIKLSKTQQGEWAEDGAAITNIRFAVDSRRYDPIRWVMVQKETGTTVFEPEVVLLPYASNVSEGQHIQALAKGPSHVSPNRLFMINANATGGSPQLDVSFNPVADGRSPQLAIIDKSGNWSVWDITGSRSVRPKNLQPILTARGNITTASVPGPLGTSPSIVTHRVMWLAVDDTRASGLHYGMDAAYEGYHWGMYPRAPLRSKHVLVCSDTDVRLYDGAHGEQLAGIRLVNRVERILDIQRCPFSSSQVLVLTTAALFWLQVQYNSTGEPRITVILSCAHYKKRNAYDKTLLFDTAPLPAAGSLKQCVVLITSPQDNDTDMFTLTKPTDNETAHVTYQSISLNLPPDIRTTLVSALPLLRIKQGGSKDIQSGDQPYTATSTRVIQLFGLGADLSLKSSLFTVSDASFRDLGRPEPLEGRKASGGNMRQKYLKHFGNSFVVSDGLEDDGSAHVRRSQPARSHPKLASGSTSAAKKSVNMEMAYVRLLNLASTDDGQTKMGEGLAPFLHRRVAAEVGDDDHLRVCSLSELLSDKLGAINLDTINDDLAEFRDKLPDLYDGRAQLTELGVGALPGDLRSLAETLSVLSYSTDGVANKEQQLVLRLTTELYLSRIGISIPPPHLSGPSLFHSQSQSQLPSRSQSTLSQRSEHLPSSLPSSPPLVPSHPHAAYSQPPSSQLLLEPMDLDDTLPDPGPLARLRQYVTIPTTVLSQPLPAPTRLVSHWIPGTDPSSYIWRGEDSRAALQEESEARRRKRDEARRRRMEKRLTGLQLAETRETESQPPLGLPRIIQSSQPRGPGLMSSQLIQPSPVRPGIQSSQVTGMNSQSQIARGSRISMSQVVPGPFGSRPGGGAAKKKKGKSGFR